RACFEPRMSETDAKPKETKKYRGAFAWADVSTPEGAKEACTAGAAAAGWLFLSYGVMTAYSYFTGKILFSDQVLDNDAAKFVVVGMFAGIALIALFLAVGLARSQSIIAAVIIFLWVIVETVMKFTELSAIKASGGSMVINVIMFLAALSGVRGSIAA